MPILPAVDPEEIIKVLESVALFVHGTCSCIIPDVPKVKLVVSLFRISHCDESLVIFNSFRSHIIYVVYVVHFQVIY